MKSFLLGLCLCLSLVAAMSSLAQPARQMVVTFDDLPYVNSAGQPFLVNAQRVTKALLNVLKAEYVPTVNFVNESKLYAAGEIDARVALLQQWVDAGHVLGNHTYSHPDLNTQTVEQFQDEIIKGDTLTRRLMQKRQPYQLYFRHPMTHTGETKEKKEAIEKFLAARGYQVTPHTIENSDYIFTVPYSRALRDRDTALQQRLRTAYLDYTLAATEFAEKISPQIFGREIPQVLLLHANDINADGLAEMLKRFKVRGYQFITLDAAMADAAYQTRDETVNQRGPTWLWRWMKSKGLNVSFKDDPEPPEWVMELYRQR
jgi:peptidoglycan/xylan/chitin deacetylase (PgdA/CDA1 family)